MSTTNIIQQNNIKLKVKAENWEEAVREAGKILKDNGYIHDIYIDAMVRTVKEIGPYMVIAQGLALPHARPENGVIKSGISFITLENPVFFGNADNDPVYIVIALAGSNNASHLDIIKTIAYIFEDTSMVSKIHKMEKSEEVLEVFNNVSDKII